MTIGNLQDVFAQLDNLQDVFAQPQAVPQAHNTVIYLKVDKLKTMTTFLTAVCDNYDTSDNLISIVI